MSAVNIIIEYLWHGARNLCKDNNCVHHSCIPVCAINLQDNLLQLCNASVLNTSCARDVMIINYASLLQVSESTIPFCIQETEDLFCDALRKCDDNDFTLVKEIVCLDIRQMYYTAEWRILEVSNVTGGLFNCDDYGRLPN